jgi:hypothetical protein
LWFITLDDTHTHTHTHSHTLGRTPLDRGSARRMDLYLTTQNKHKNLTSIHQTGFEPAIPASERPQTHALDRVATDENSGSTKYGEFFIREVTHLLMKRIAPRSKLLRDTELSILASIDFFGKVCRFCKNLSPSVHTERTPHIALNKIN